MLADSLISAENVGMSFGGGAPVLEGVNAGIGSGEFVSIVGPSGCGKSTLLRMIAGLIEPTAGRIAVAGMAPAAARRGRERVAFVFQEPRLLPWRTVVENIALPLELEGAPAAEQKAAVAESLGLIGLAESDAGKFPRMLSGGMRMRVSLARSLVTRPGVLLLDEPFGALDDMLRQQLNEEILRIWAQQKWTGVFVTHNVSEAVFLSQRILVMSRGPGRIASEVPIPLPFPRQPELRADPEFARLTGIVSSRLRGEAA